MAQRRYIVWVDFNGRTRLTLIDSAAGAAAVQAALLAQSNADVLNSEDAALTINAAPAPVAAVYQGVGDAAALIFADAAGAQVTLQLPAPKAAIFMADQETVSAPAIAGVTAAVIGTVLTPAGGLVTAYLAGMRRKAQREDY